MESYNIIILIFGIICLLLLIMLYFINRIIQHKNKIDTSFIAIKKLLEEKTELIDKMIYFVEQNLEHEKNYQRKLKQLKDLNLTIKNNKEGINSLKKIEKELLSFNKLENTYKKLTKNKEYLQIKEEISNNQEQLKYALDSYDKGVINYNNYKENLLINFLSKLCKLPEYECYNK